MRSLRRRTLIRSAGLVALSTPWIKPARAATSISFRLDWSIYGSHAPFFLGHQEKLFARAGLAVSIGQGQGSAMVARLVGQGRDPLGFVDFGSMIFAVAAGIPLIAVQRLISNNMCMISHADAPVRTPQQLAGKTVAYAPSESTAQMMPALLRQNHVDPKKVRVITPAATAKNALFLQRRADAIPGSLNVQPAQLEALGAKLSIFMFSDFGVRLMNNGIVANADWLKRNAEAAKTFLQVVTKAFVMAKADPARAVDAVVKQMPEQARNRSVLMRQLELTFPLLTTPATQGKPFGYMAASDWTTTQDLLSHYGGLSKTTPVHQLYTNNLLPT